MAEISLDYHKNRYPVQFILYEEERLSDIMEWVAKELDGTLHRSFCDRGGYTEATFYFSDEQAAVHFKIRWG
jgi:hypothetical protein